ncbi:hypothetical protein GCM10022224_000760 [Nonomuraea antimicrobica]|uniref:Uncharacterized protein n=1 Tax=Nonomuraea antimicrobica TaxID=561173 RepID=A0ABP7AWD9_9ACTN
MPLTAPALTHARMNERPPEQAGLVTALGCLVLFIPAILRFNGPWRRTTRTTAAFAVGEAEA